MKFYYLMFRNEILELQKYTFYSILRNLTHRKNQKVSEIYIINRKINLYIRRNNAPVQYKLWHQQNSLIRPTN
jgi:hypothetical protein